MEINYKSASITVTTGTKVKPSDFTIQYFSCSADAAFYVRFRDSSGWGDWVLVEAGVEFSDIFEAVEVEFKAVESTSNINYYMRGGK